MKTKVRAYTGPSQLNHTISAAAACESMLNAVFLPDITYLLIQLSYLIVKLYKNIPLEFVAQQGKLIYLPLIS
jgi:hypothetical protein